MAVKGNSAIGRRKTSVARIYSRKGSGIITVNGREADKYFTIPRHYRMAFSPLSLTGSDKTLDLKINVSGGGITGQAGAISLGIARALQGADSNLRTPLKRVGLLRRDARMVERKKYGRRKARRGTQFSKR
ncbi:MAG: 30S ribosomal protein S9 [Spirochaetales bacterium]|nr:30S ribosomal protein S9 [Spirochaetales bacterium]